ncbi:MAG TPA: ABC transporter permease [Chthonomonadales bacterium]|nr:ABC transporter permease [Chthonomonadales bacterium]
MTILHSLLSALTNLRVNKLRSVLTMLGVIIGVSAVIVMVSLVEGARAQIVSEFERLGSHLIIIAYDPSREERRGQARRIDSLSMDDVRAIRERCDLIDQVSAELPVPTGFTARYREREFDVGLNGIEPAYKRLRNLTIAEGRFIGEEDLQDWRKVCVIGARVRRELFPNENPIGRDIDIRGVSVTVIGVLQSKGTAGIAEQEDRSILLPITSIQKRFVGREVVGVIWAQPRPEASIDAAMDQVWETLMRRHDNAPGFRVDSQQNILSAVSRVLNIFGLVLGGVAGLALLVGGIGIMNIMLVSVTERTREIGLRKAVGARRRDILVQFLIESATLSGTGGLLGIAIGAGVAFAIGAISKEVMTGGMMGNPGIPTHLPAWSILGAFAFSAFVGVFFGMWPAVRAARLDPIEALRHE